MEKSKTQGWKTTAIIFMIIALLLILAFVLYFIGATQLNIELDCKIQCLESGYSYSDLTGEEDSCNCEGVYLYDTTYGQLISDKILYLEEQLNYK